MGLILIPGHIPQSTGLVGALFCLSAGCKSEWLPPVLTQARHALQRPGHQGAGFRMEMHFGSWMLEIFRIRFYVGSDKSEKFALWVPKLVN